MKKLLRNFVDNYKRGCSIRTIHARLSSGNVQQQLGAVCRVEQREGGWWELLHLDRGVVGHHRQDMNR